MDALFRSLNKGELAPVYYLYGLEDVLKDEAVRAILDRALDPAMREFNLDQRSAGQVDPDEVHALDWMLERSRKLDVVALTALGQRPELFREMERRGASRVGPARIRQLVRRARRSRA